MRVHGSDSVPAGPFLHAGLFKNHLKWGFAKQLVRSGRSHRELLHGMGRAVLSPGGTWKSRGFRAHFSLPYFKCSHLQSALYSGNRAERHFHTLCLRLLPPPHRDRGRLLPPKPGNRSCPLSLFKETLMVIDDHGYHNIHPGATHAPDCCGFGLPGQASQNGLTQALSTAVSRLKPRFNCQIGPKTGGFIRGPGLLQSVCDQ